MGLNADGSGNLLNCGSGAALDNIWAGGGTCTGWVNADSPGELGGGYVANKLAGWHWQLNDFFATDVLISLVQDFTITDARWNSPASSAVFGTWQHGAITYDSDSAANDPIFYINGASVTVTEATTPVGTAISDAGDDLTLFNRPALDRDLEGAIEDLRLFSRILSANEILSIYTQRGVDGIPGVARWPMNEQGDGVNSTAAAGAIKDWQGGNDATMTSDGTFPPYLAGENHFRRRAQ